MVILFACWVYVNDASHLEINVVEIGIVTVYENDGIQSLLLFQFKDDKRSVRHFTIRDIETGALLKDEGLFHLCYIELGKEPSAKLKHWVDFFNGKDMQVGVPDYIKQAYALVDYANLDESERDMISAAERREQDMIGYLNFAEVRGIEIGEARGEARGAQKTLLQTARNLIAQGVSPEVIQKATGLSLQEIEQLQ